MGVSRTVVNTAIAADLAFDDQGHLQLPLYRCLLELLACARFCSRKRLGMSMGHTYH